MAFEAAARFLATALPWPEAVAEPPEFFVNVHTRDPKNPQYGLYGKACRSLDEALRHIEWLNSLNQDVWVCMSAQRTGKQKTNKAGRIHYGAIRNVGNAHSHRSIYIDIDVKERGFPDIDSAVKALGDWRRVVGLPVPSLLVGSGSGLHAHWTFSDPIDTARWQVLADKLVSAMQQHGLAPIDYGVTRDPVRLLRVPDTFNYKTTPPKPVQLLHAGNSYDVSYLEGNLAGYSTQKSVSGAPTSNQEILWPENMPPPPKNAVYTPLAPDVGKILPTLEQLTACCPAINEALTTGGEGHAQPLWHAMARVATFTLGQEEDLLSMSELHPEYDEASARALFHRVKNDKKRGDMGWPRCQSIRDAGGVGCAGCPNLAAGKSPFNFIIAEETKVEAAPPSTNLAGNTALRTIDNDLLASPPPGFTFENGKMWQLTEPKSENEAPGTALVFPFELDAMWFQHDPYRLNFVAATDQRGSRQITIKAEDCAGLERLSNSLARQGIILKRSSLPRFHYFMASWLEEMRARRIATVASVKYGWSYDEGKPSGFVYGKHHYTITGSVPAAFSDAVLSETYMPVGELKPWLAAAQLITDQKRPSLDAILASSFAAPLIQFTGEQGFMLSAFSPESGMQKSTAMRVAQAVWGDPVRGMNSLNDTANSINKKLGMLRHLPMYYDEIKMEEGNRRNLDLLFELTQGKTKSRLQRDAEQQTVDTWATLMQCASNSSMAAFIGAQSKTTTAGIHRVFEFQVVRDPSFVGQVSLGDAGRRLSDLNNNYGRAGEVYADWLGKHPQEITDRVHAAKDAITSATNARPEERFWVTAVAVLLLGAKFSNELKLTNIDVEALSTFLLNTFNTLRKQVVGANVDLSSAITVQERLAEYINQRRRHTMVTDFMPSGRGRPRECTPHNPLELTHAPSFMVRIAKTDEKIRFAKSDFWRWCEQQQIAPALLLQAMKRQLGAKEVRTSITSGVAGYPTLAETLVEIDNSNKQLGSLFDFT